MKLRSQKDHAADKRGTSGPGEQDSVREEVGERGASHPLTDLFNQKQCFFMLRSLFIYTYIVKILKIKQTPHICF